MNKLSALSLFLSFGLFYQSPISFAQGNSVSDYVPPPLFGSAPSTVAPKKTEEPAPDTPIQLRQNENNPTLKKPLPKRPKKTAVRYIPDAPVPKKKPTPPKGLVKKDEPIGSLPVKEAEPKIKPEKTTRGVVKGPKTMPAVKKTDVDVEVVDKNVEETQTDMLARVQEQAAEEKRLEEKKKASKPVSKPNSLFKDRLVLVFDLDIATLSEDKSALLDEQVVPALLETDNRLNITAYASPSATANADRRMALSRGLAVRSFLIEAGIKPSQINVRSLGAQTNTQPYDRVELDLIK